MVDVLAVEGMLGRVHGLELGAPDLLLLGGGAQAGGAERHAATTDVLRGHLDAGLIAAIGAPGVGLQLLAVLHALLLEVALELLPEGVAGVVGDEVGVASNSGVEVLDGVGPLLLVSLRTRMPRDAAGLGQLDDDVDVEPRLTKRLDRLAVAALVAAAALRGTHAVDLEPVADGQQDVGELRRGRVPQVQVEEEVELLQALPGVQGVGHVHEVAGLADAHVDGVLGALGTVAAVPNGRGVAPDAQVGKHGDVVHAGDVGPLVRSLGTGEREDGDLGTHVELFHADGALGLAAVAAGGVEVARQANDGVDGARALHRVAGVLDGKHVLDAAVAVARLGMERGGVGRGGLDDEVGVDARDLGDGVGVVVVHVGAEVIPHGLGLDLGAVLERDLDLAALVVGVDERVATAEVGLLNDVARLDTGGGVGQVGHEAVHLARALLELEGLLALPVARGGVVPHELAAQLVVHHEAGARAALDDVALLEELRLEGIAVEARARSGLGRLHVLHHEVGQVGPALDPHLVVELVVHDDVEPAQGHGGVGAGAQGQPDVGLLAQVGHARVDDDELLGLRSGVDHGAARVVVVGELGAAAPHDQDGSAVDGGVPGVGAVGLQRGTHVARALADLVGLVGVHGVKNARETQGAGHAVDARGAAHRETGVAATLSLDLVDLLSGGLKSLVPGDTHPAGIVLALGVRALQRVAQTVGVVASLQRGLALRAAVARRGHGRLVALDLHGAAVLHGYPHRALHLAAAAAHGADALGRALIGGHRARVVGLGQSRGRLGTGHNQTGSRSQAHKRAS